MIETAFEGPYFDDLHVGQVFPAAPSVTLTEGRAAAHQAIVGDRLEMALDETLALSVIGNKGFVHPSLVWDIAIGQSTVVTRRVKANLFYRGLSFRRIPLMGDTLRTTTRVVALRQNQPRSGRTPTGLAALAITTVDQHGADVLDFWRCAMLPLRDENAVTGHHDDLDAIVPSDAGDAITSPIADWHLENFQRTNRGLRYSDLTVGIRIQVSGGDVVSSAPELARLTLNIAAAHHDAEAAGGRRLVYGGHTIDIALAQANRALPGMVTVLAWHGCDHLGPVHEGDTLYSDIVIEQVDPLPGAGGMVHLRSRVFAEADRRPVLDWRYVTVFA